MSERKPLTLRSRLPTGREPTDQIIQRAGVAISRLAVNASISITRIDGAPFEKNIYEPTKGILGSSVTPAEVAELLWETVQFKAENKDNGICVAIPIATESSSIGAFREKKIIAHDHLHVFLNGPCVGLSQGRDMNIVFIDLTPGQVAAKLVHGSFYRPNQWGYRWPGGGEVVLGDVPELNIQELMDKLILPLLTDSAKHLDCIGVLRPEEAFPDISCVALEARFPDTPIRWMTLEDLSYGAALVMHRENTIYTTYM